MKEQERFQCQRVSMMSELEFDEVPYSFKIPVKLSQRPAIDWSIPFSLLVNGQPRSGKGVFLDQLIQDSHENGILTILLFSALGYENLFPIINKHCKAKWKIQVEKYPDKYRNLLPSCQCWGIIPCIWIVPNYIQFEMKTVEAFNKREMWESFDEYKKEFLEITTEQRKLLKQFKLPKPEYMIKKDKLKIMKFTPPTTPARVEVFRKEMRNILDIAKREHRIVIHTPAIYPTDHHGKVEKYCTVAEMFRYIQDDFCDDPLMNYIENAKTKWDKANNAISIFLNEIRAVAPSTKLSGDKESGVSKRETYNFMPEKRHAKSRVIADCQSPSDLFDGVRMQFSELKAFKRTTFALIGEENQKFFTQIENYCIKIYESWGFNPNNVPVQAKQRLVEQYNICRMGEIPDDKILFRLENGEWSLKTVEQAKFHHKIDKIDNFKQLTGIRWTARNIEKDVPTIKEKASKTEKNDEYQIIEKMRIEKQGFPAIIKHFLDIDIEKGIEDSKWKVQTPKNLSNKYNNWLNRKKQSLR